MVRPVRSIVLRRTAAGRRAEPAIVSDGQASQARLVRKTVACEQTLLPIWHGITAVQVRATITATAHISADLYGANPTMWRRPRMLSTSVHERHDNREGRSPPDAFPLVAMTRYGSATSGL